MDAAELFDTSVIDGMTVYACVVGGRERRHVVAPARNRPARSRTVHLIRLMRAADGQEAAAAGTLCRGPKPGALRLGGLAEGEHFCTSCLYQLSEEDKREHQTVKRCGGEYTDWLAAGQVKGHVRHRADGLAEVALNVPVPLLVSVIRDIPGRRYDPDLKAWLVPEAWSADLVASLSAAGVEVRETPPA